MRRETKQKVNIEIGPKCYNFLLLSKEYVLHHAVLSDDLTGGDLAATKFNKLCFCTLLLGSECLERTF